MDATWHNRPSQSGPVHTDKKHFFTTIWTEMSAAKY